MATPPFPVQCTVKEDCPPGKCCDDNNECVECPPTTTTLLLHLDIVPSTGNVRTGLVARILICVGKVDIVEKYLQPHHMQLQPQPHQKEIVTPIRSVLKGNVAVRVVIVSNVLKIVDTLGSYLGLSVTGSSRQNLHGSPPGITVKIKRRPTSPLSSATRRTVSSRVLSNPALTPANYNLSGWMEDSTEKPRTGTLLQSLNGR